MLFPTMLNFTFDVPVVFKATLIHPSLGKSLFETLPSNFVTKFFIILIFIVS